VDLGSVETNIGSEIGWTALKSKKSHLQCAKYLNWLLSEVLSYKIRKAITWMYHLKIISFMINFHLNFMTNSSYHNCAHLNWNIQCHSYHFVHDVILRHEILF
jgi:hypothetical protein